MGLERFQIKGAPTCRVIFNVEGLFKKTLPKDAVDKPENYKYNGVIFIPKSDEEKVKQILEEYGKAFDELKGRGFAGKTASVIDPKNNCLVDGDKAADEKDGKEHLRGHYLLKVASKKFRPIITDMAKRVITNGVPVPGVDVENLSEEELCNGDHVFVNVSFWTYSEKTYQGIGCNIHAIKRAGSGESVGGASQDVDDYIDTEGYE